MFRLSILALSAVILKTDISQASDSGLIVGGEIAEINEYPYQVSLYRNGRFSCGGSILTPNAILTAAHCTVKWNPEAMEIRAGSSFVDKGGQVQSVIEKHVHPKFEDNGNADYDVSILLLKKPFELNEFIKPIQLVSTLVPDGTLAQVTGWGRLSESGSLPEQLQVVSVPKVNDKLCKELYYAVKITPRMTCYGYLEGGKDSCQGDSGGPIVVDNKQVGIVSWGKGCAKPKLPGVYTNIFNEEIMQFIKKFI